MKKYIFDFDGTLVDSMTLWAEWVASELDKSNIKYPDTMVKDVCPLGTVGVAEYMYNLGYGESVDEVVKKLDDFAVYEYTYNIPMKPYAHEKLFELKSKGYSVNLLTACNHNLLDVCLRRLGIFELFDNIWSCEEDLSANKSEKRVYDIAIKKLDTVAENCIFVDDNVIAVRTAKSAGMYGVGIYDEASKDFENEMKETADRYIYSFKEL